MSTDEDRYNEQLQLLINGLVERTRDALAHNNRLWEQPEQGVYELSLKKTSMRIFSQGHNGQKPYVFELYDGFGDLVDRVVTDPWGDPIHLDELYNLVAEGEKQKAKRAALADALNELDIPPF